ncbi:MAG: T9SS type A sorting domain-containing protein [Bacteroidota bacterium]
MLRSLLFSFFLLLVVSLSAQTGCPGCLIDLPTLPEDTIYLSEAPDGQAGVFYDADLSFRLPLSTTPVNEQDPSTPPGLPIDEFTILGVANLPVGMSWEANALSFITAETTDGCVKLCGTPLLAGFYEVEVVIEARISFLTQQTSFSFPLLIEPAETVTEGFTVVNNSGCGEVTASFINNVPSGGIPGFSYLWFFGNGQSTTEENPGDQVYNQPGEYIVDYQAIVDTTGYFLTDVTLNESPCSDLLSNPDYKFDLYDPSGERIFTAPIIDNTDAPVSWEVFIPLEEGTYEIRFVDDDGGLDGADDLCGVIFFNRDEPGVFQNSDSTLTATIDIIHPVDTINSSEIITVFEIPSPPVVSLIDMTPICDGDTVNLVSLNYEDGLSWYRDSLLLVEEVNDTLEVTFPGEYWVTHTTADGCSATSLPVTVEFTDNPDDFELTQNGNLIRILDESNLPADFSFTWLYDGEPILSATELLLCADKAGPYTLQITDNATGCSTRATIDADYDPNTDCTTSTDEAELATQWRLFPNPVQQFLFVEGPFGVDAELIIYDALGRELLRGTMGEYQGQLDVSRLASGAYFYRLQLLDGIEIKTGSLIKTP